MAQIVLEGFDDGVDGQPVPLTPGSRGTVTYSSDSHSGALAALITADDSSGSEYVADAVTTPARAASGWFRYDSLAGVLNAGIEIFLYGVGYSNGAFVNACPPAESVSELIALPESGPGKSVTFDPEPYVGQWLQVSFDIRGTATLRTSSGGVIATVTNEPFPSGEAATEVWVDGFIHRQPGHVASVLIDDFTYDTTILGGQDAVRRTFE